MKQCPFSLEFFCFAQSALSLTYIKYGIHNSSNEHPLLWCTLQDYLCQMLALIFHFLLRPIEDSIGRCPHSADNPHHYIGLRDFLTELDCSQVPWRDMGALGNLLSGLTKPFTLRPHLGTATFKFIIYYHRWFTSESHSMLCMNRIKCSTGSEK